jgi:prophage antirepressor-like protein
MSNIVNITDKAANLVPFKFENYSIRTITDEKGDTWFIGKDVCEALGFANPSDAMNTHCRGIAKRYPIVDSLGRTQQARILSEPDIMRLIVNCSLPSAQEFERLVFEEILPTIRKTGSYSIQGKIPKTFAEALRLAADLQEALDEANKKIEEDKPKVEFAMAVRRLDGSCLIGEFAKAIGWGRNSLFKRLRADGYLQVTNLPYQKYIDQELFTVIENTPFIDSEGKSHPTFTTRITGKGQVYLEKKLRPRTDSDE